MLKLCIVVPSAPRELDGEGRRTVVPWAMKTVEDTLSSVFGGWTRVPTAGGWISDSGERIEDLGYLYFSLTDHPVGILKSVGYNLSECIGFPLRQESIIFWIEEVREAEFVLPAGFQDIDKYWRIIEEIKRKANHEQ